jgi:hypothetical protein
MRNIREVIDPFELDRSSEEGYKSAGFDCLCTILLQNRETLAIDSPREKRPVTKLYAYGRA